MRHDYDQFVERNAEVICLGPDGPNAFKRYWEQNQVPFIGCADIRSKVAEQYDQVVNWLKLGRMPAVLIIDANGFIRYSRYGENMADIPENELVLGILEKINAEGK